MDWLPLESNPETINPYLVKLGFKSDYEFVDVLAVEDWALEMVPQPVKAVTLLFCIKPGTEEYDAAQKARITADGVPAVDPSVYFTKQTIGNACGTIACLHVVANTAEEGDLAEGSFFSEFIARTRDLSPEERGSELEKREDVAEAHAAVAVEGQSDVIEDTWQHFITFVCKNGRLLELDGRKDFPIDHGECTPETLLQQAAAVARDVFMARDPEELRFTLMAVAKAMPEEEEEAAAGGAGEGVASA